MLSSTPETPGISFNTFFRSIAADFTLSRSEPMMRTSRSCPGGPAVGSLIERFSSPAALGIRACHSLMNWRLRTDLSSGLISSTNTEPMLSLLRLSQSPLSPSPLREMAVRTNPPPKFASVSHAACSISSRYCATWDSGVPETKSTLAKRIGPSATGKKLKAIRPPATHPKVLVRIAMASATVIQRARTPALTIGRNTRSRKRAKPASSFLRSPLGR